MHPPPPEADRALAAFGPPYVVKDDALAAGKGVLVTSDLAAARAHARGCGTVVIEEFLDGPEVSLFAVTDGVTAVPLLPAQDFKRARDGDQGPNTGGMGAYAPLPWAPGDLPGQTIDRVIHRRSTPWRGAARISRAAVRGTGPDLGQPQGGGVQRAVRRPGAWWFLTGWGARWGRCCMPLRPGTWRAPRHRSGARGQRWWW